jgi:hypothetical protein
LPDSADLVLADPEPALHPELAGVVDEVLSDTAAGPYDTYVARALPDVHAATRAEMPVPPRQGVAGASKLVAHAGKFILRKASLWLRISIPLVTERLGQGARASVRSAFS